MNEAPPNLNFRTLDLNLLRVFDAVMQERSLTRAARTLSLTQPAVSNALRRLRESLGDDLVRRAGQGIVPTARALVLWPEVRQALRLLHDCLVPSTFVPAHATSTFVLAMADATAAGLIPGLVELIDRDAPGVSLRVVPLTTRDPRKLLEDEKVDLALGYFPAALADLTARAQVGKAVNFAHLRLYDVDYVCVMRADHPLAQGPLTLKRFCAARHLLVSFSGEPFDYVDEALSAAGRQRRVVVTVNQFFAAGEVVARSSLLAALPRHFVAGIGVAGALAVRELPLDMPAVHVDALWHLREQHSGAHQWLRDAVARCAQAIYP